MTSALPPEPFEGPQAEIDPKAGTESAPGWWDDLSARLATITPIFNLGTGSQACLRARAQAADDPLGLLMCVADLIDHRTGVAAELLRCHASARGLPPRRHAASLVFQRYAHRVAGVALAAWFLEDVVVDVRAAQCQVLVRAGSPVGLLLRAPRMRSAVDAETLVTTVIDDHLMPVAEALHVVSGAGMPNLWGNMGAAIGGACRHLARHLPADHVESRGQAILDRRPRLARSGTFRILAGPKGERLFFDRRSCCHWYVVRDGKFCSWCSRLDRDARTRRFEQIMANES